MNIINDYNQLPIGNLQKVRLYLQGRPLLSLWTRHRRKQPKLLPDWVRQIDSELTEDFVAVDCGGWYFANQQRSCIAVELIELSSRYWNSVHYEYDYMTWHPTYLPAVPVLAYYSTYFKYCEFEDFLTFCLTWIKFHPKLIIALDPTKVKVNYLKFDLLESLQSRLPNCGFRVYDNSDFNLFFTITQQ